MTLSDSFQLHDPPQWQAIRSIRDHRHIYRYVLSVLSTSICVGPHIILKLGT